MPAPLGPKAVVQYWKKDVLQQVHDFPDSLDHWLALHKFNFSSEISKAPNTLKVSVENTPMSIKFNNNKSPDESN